MSDPIKVTLSGNSTPLLQNPFAPAFMGNTQSVPLNGLVEADSRLAIEQGKGLTNSQGAVVLGLLGELLARLAEAENSRNIARDVAEAFRDTIRRATGNHDAVHGLMILCQSHKSLAEAEARAGRVEEAVRVLAEALVARRGFSGKETGIEVRLNGVRCLGCGCFTFDVYGDEEPFPWGKLGHYAECPRLRVQATEQAVEQNPAARAAVEGAR